MARPVQSPRFGAVITAMVTPFAEDGSLDVDGAAGLARWLAGHGSDALVLAGTTGEGPALADDERADLWRAVREAVTIPVIAGAGTNDTRHSVELVALAQDVGVDAVLAVTPYYSRPSQTGISQHFRALAAATSLPVLLYDIPVRTGRRIAGDTILRLALEVPNIVGVKDAAGDVAGSARLIASAPEHFELYSGEDGLTLPLLAVGAVGVVSVASHWAGETMADMVAAFARGDVGAARARNAQLIESFEFESSEEFPNPLPAKAACRALGLRVGQCRPPMGPAPSALDERASAVLAHLGGRDVPAGGRPAAMGSSAPARG
jgi:4-hydroxy-tetrahydrodipicolinate synthase